MSRGGRHLLKTEHRGEAIAWCGRFVKIRTGWWTRIWSQTSCNDCIKTVHTHMNARGLDPMKDKVE